MNEKRYIKLEVGKRRREGDEVRKLGKFAASFENYTGNNAAEYTWQLVQLLNHKILASDLMIAEFRRPI